MTDSLSFVTGSGAPPEAGTRNSGLKRVGVKRIVPSRPQAPPRAEVVASQRAMDGPPEASIRFSLPLAKNPRYWLSGDQKGRIAPSVPSRGFAVDELSGLTHRSCRPLKLTAENAKRWPSGESAGGAGEVPAKTNFSSAGGVICETIAGRGRGARAM